MQALKELPSGYDLHATLDLAENRLAAIGVNVLGVGFLLLFGWLAFFSFIKVAYISFSESSSVKPAFINPVSTEML